MLCRLVFTLPSPLKTTIPKKVTRIFINPPGDYQLDADDEIIVIAEDNDSFSIGELQMVDPRDVPDFEEAAEAPVKMLLCGFRRDLDDMINEIDKWVQPGSTLVSFADADCDERMEILIEGGLSTNFQNITLVNLKGKPAVNKDLVALADEGYPVESFDAVIILTEQEDGQVALNCDSRTLVTTLLVRDIQKKAGGKKKGTVVAEILDPRTERLLKMANLDDFISSNDLVSMALGQIAEESDIHGLLEEIFCPEGNEMHIKDIRLYASEGETLNWWEIVARARMRGEVAMGWIKPDIYPYPVLNPGNDSQRVDEYGKPCAAPAGRKVCESKLDRMVWKYGDKLVVFSED